MGYTHYFRVNKRIKGKSAKDVEILYQKAIKDCHKVILYYQNKYKGTENGLSGYSAYTKLGQYGGININGKRELKCETFILREHFTQNTDFNFCKTRQQPYDIVVVACLAILQFHLKDSIEVSSDGDYWETIAGVELANKVLRRTKNKIQNFVKFIPKQDIREA